MNAATVPETPPDTDFREHVATYRAFVEMTKVAILATATTLIGLLLITYGANRAPLTGTVVVLAGIIAGAFGLASGSWKPSAIVLAVTLLLALVILV